RDALQLLSSLPLHDALPIWSALADVEYQSTEIRLRLVVSGRGPAEVVRRATMEGATATSRVAPSSPETRSTRSWAASAPSRSERSEEHTSELQSRFDVACRL